MDDLKLQKSSMNLFQVWTVPAVRKSVVMGCVINFITSGSGIVAVGAFATIVLKQSGLESTTASYANVAICVSTFPTVVIASFMVDRVGRRPLVMYGTMVLTFLNATMMGLLLYTQYYPSSDWVGYGVAGNSVLFMIAFGLGPPVVQFFIMLELVPLNAKGAAQTLAMFSNFCGTFSTSLAFYPLDGAVGGYCYLIFIVPMTAACVYYYFRMPETRNKTVGDVMEAMASKKKAKGENNSDYSKNVHKETRIESPAAANDMTEVDLKSYRF